MNRAERRKKGVKVEKQRTYIFHSKKEILDACISGIAQEEMDAEIKRQVLEWQEKVMMDTDAAILWTLHVHFGFGAERLKRYYRAFVDEYHQMRERYEGDDVYAERVKLKEIGVDVDELQKEYELVDGKVKRDEVLQS